MAVAERFHFPQVLRSTFLAILAVCLGVFTQPSASIATPLTSAANIPFSGISPGGVNMATGEIIIVARPDLYLDGPFPLEFGRYYASMLARESLASSHLGPNWLGTYDWTLSIAGSNATMVTNEGAAIRFTQGVGGGWNLTSPTYAKFKLDLVGGAWRVTNPVDGRIYFFDGTTWLLTSILDEHGNALTLSYGSGGRLGSVIDGLGRALTFSYDGLGDLAQVTDGTRTVHYFYTGGLLTGVGDAGTHPWSYAYAPGAIPGLLSSVTEPLGNVPATQNFDGSGRVLSQMDAMGGQANYQYDTPSGNIFADPLGNPWTYQHDSGGRLTSLMDPMGGPHSYLYDALGRLQNASRPLGDPTSFLYDAVSGMPSDVKFADNSMAHWSYSSHLVSGATLYDLSTASFPDGSNESYTRDANGNITDLMDRGGFHWTGTYNARGQLLTWLNPTGGITTLNYDPQGRLSSHQDNAGNVTGFQYDGSSRLVQITWPDLSHRNYAYDPLDAMTSLSDERGKAWSYGYDADERLTSETDPLSQVTSFGYDPMDRVTLVTDPLGHSAHYAYDPTGRLLSMTDRSGRMTSYQYDARNNLTGIQDPAGGTDGFTYDPDGRMLTEHDPLMNSSSFSYDFLDRVTHVTNRVGTGFDFGHDAMGRLTSATGPLGYSHTFSYDPRGFLTSYHDATSQTDFQRTPLGEVSRVVDPNRNEWPRNYDPQGRLINASDPLSRSTTFEYDALSRVIHVGRPDGSLQQIQYDSAGRILGQTFTGGTTLTYGYDDANRMTSATGATFEYDAAGRMITSNAFPFTFDPDGRILSETLAPGKVESYAYDSRGLPSHVMDWRSGTTSFTYDPAQRLTGISRPNGTTGDYGYDAADQMISSVEKSPGPSQISSITITRDALGRPSSVNRRVPLMPTPTMPAMNNLTYDAASELNGATHDALGRTTGEGSRLFQWDGASRLIHFVAGVDSPTITVDAFGSAQSFHQGASQTVQQAWTYTRDHPDMDDTEVDLPSPILRLHVRMPSGLMLYSVDGSTGARHFYHYDEAGNTAYLTNDTGSVTTEYAYGPFGGVKSLGQTEGNPFTFGAAGGRVAIGGSGGLWTDGADVYDERTMRVISGLATGSGPGGRDPGPTGSPGAAVEIVPPWPWSWKDPGPPGSPGSMVGRQPGPTGDPGASVELNPQPFPPGTLVGKQPGPTGDPGAFVELNPQPFPPGTLVGRNPGPGGDPGDLVELNPQPLPPGTRTEIVPPWPWSDKNPGPISSPGAAVEIVPPWPWDWRQPGPIGRGGENFGKVKADGNAIGDGDFGGGYSYSLGSHSPYKPNHISPGSDISELIAGASCATVLGPHSAGGGGGAGKVHVHDLTITRPPTTVGPALALPGQVRIDFSKTDAGNLYPPGPPDAWEACTWCAQ